MSFNFIRNILGAWHAFFADRAERRTRAAAARAIAAEIEKVKAQLAAAARMHRPTKQLNSRLYTLMTQRLIQDLSQ